MRQWSIGLFVAVLVAAIVGYSGLFESAQSVARLLFFLFVFLLALAVITALVRESRM